MDRELEQLQNPGRDPRTIEELRLWYAWHKLPPEEVTRFFIGKDIAEPKAFGIYKNEDGECVVYKNKASGERAIRYQGRDEELAVSELLQRLRDEIASQKARNKARRQPPLRAEDRGGSPAEVGGRPSRMFSKKEKGFLGTMIAGVIALVMLASGNGIPDGYYQYQSYYRQGSTWYRYQPSTDDWYKTTLDRSPRTMPTNIALRTSAASALRSHNGMTTAAATTTAGTTTAGTTATTGTTVTPTGTRTGDATGNQFSWSLGVQAASPLGGGWRGSQSCRVI